MRNSNSEPRHSDFPLAYFITWTTYGTWLSGDARGWRKRGSREVEPPDERLRRRSAASMTSEAIVLALSQRSLIENVIDRHCTVRGWQLHARNARSNHVHVVVSVALDGKRVRSQLKAWCSHELSKQAYLHAIGSNGINDWFTERGDVEWVESTEDLENVVLYVKEFQ